MPRLNYRLVTAVRWTIEQLERRRLLTSNLFLDFGDAFPAGGLQMNVLTLRDTFGSSGLQGPNLNQADDATTPGVNEAFNDATNLIFNPTAPLVTYDYNGDGLTNGTDFTDLRANVLALAQRYYAPFDVNVQLAPAVGDLGTSADYINDVRAQLQLGLNANGERDGWVFITNMRRAADNLSVGNLQNLNGKSNGGDIGGNNAADNCGLAFADQIMAGNNTDDTRLAYTAAHEGGHDFGLRHTNNGFGNDGTSASGSVQTDNDMILQTSSNLVTDSASGVNRTNFVFATRFPLVRGDNNSVAGGGFNINDTVNHYNTLASNNNLGLRAGAAAYVTGTGAFDRLTLTDGGGGNVNVQLETFRQAGFTSQIGGTLNYSVSKANGILIEMGLNADQLIVNANIAANLTVRGMNGNDRLVVMGNNVASGSFTSGAAEVDALDNQTYLGGTLVAGSTNIQLQEFLPAGSVTVQDIDNFTYRTPNGADQVTVLAGGGGDRVTGTSDGVDLLPLVYFNVDNVTYDTAANDGGTADDRVTFARSAQPAGLQTITVNTGGGADELRLNMTSNQIPAGGISFDGGGADVGSDLLSIFGGSYTTETYNATGPSSGNIDIDGSIINYANLAPITNTSIALNLIFNATAGVDVINVIDGAEISGVDTTEINSGNGSFEKLSFANKTNVTINALGGSDAVTLFGAYDDTPGLATLDLNGDDDDDVYTLAASALIPIDINGGAHIVGDTITLDGQALDTTLASTTLSTAGKQLVSYSNVETLALINGTFNLPALVVLDVNIDVNASATLYGAGTTQRRLRGNAGGVIAPGAVVGNATAILNTGGGLDLNAGSTYSVDLNGLANGTEHDVLHVQGAVDVTGATIAGTLGYASIPGDELLIIRNDGVDPVVGTFAAGNLVTIGGQKFSIDYAYDGDGDGAFNDVALVRYGAALAADPCEPDELALFVSATTGNDNIRFVSVGGNKKIQVLINGVSEGIFEPSGLLIGFGQSGNDTMTVQVPSRESWLFGQVGNDLLTVGNNDSLLIGGVGDDTASGGNGRDVLIGGKGADLMKGGNGDDLLIGGYISFEDNTPANREKLCAIFDEWIGGTGGWKGKADHLTNGGGKNGTVVLNPTTVFDDAAIDNLQGGNSKDWFLARTSGVFKDVLDADKQELVQVI